MTLMADYQNWLSAQPLNTVRLELARTEQTLAQVSEASDLAAPDRQAVLGVWSMKHAAQRAALSRLSDPLGNRPQPQPARPVVEAERMSRTYRPAGPRHTYWLGENGRVLWGAMCGKTAREVIAHSLAAHPPGVTVRFAARPPHRVWWLLWRKVTRLTVYSSE